jgi:hypothetical protein
VKVASVAMIANTDKAYALRVCFPASQSEIVSSFDAELKKKLDKYIQLLNRDHTLKSIFNDVFDYPFLADPYYLGGIKVMNIHYSNVMDFMKIRHPR